jgi:hypothetical protein
LGLFGAIQPVEFVGAQQDEVNHRSQAEQKDALNDHCTQWIVESPNSPHGDFS